MTLEEQNKLRKLAGLAQLSERTANPLGKDRSSVEIDSGVGNPNKPYMDPTQDVEFGDSKRGPEVDEYGEEIPTQTDPLANGNSDIRTNTTDFDPNTNDPALSHDYNDEFDGDDIMARGEREYDHEYDDSMTDQLTDEEGGPWQDVLDPSDSDSAYENEEEAKQQRRKKIRARILRKAIRK